WTWTSAGSLSVFIRYISISDADVALGPMNQKSVPGPWHCAVTSPLGLVCSTSRPWAMAPLAWTMTPPRPWIVITGPEFGSPGTALVLGAGAVFTWVRLSTLGVDSVATEAPTVGLPAPDSRVMA